MNAVYTIGYGSRDIGQVVSILQQHNIQYVIDVRSAPYSRYKPEFSKDELARLLQKHGLRYVFMGHLLGGRPQDPACYIDGKVDYDKLKDTDAYRTGIARIQTAFTQQHVVAIFCSEEKPQECHRSKLIGVSLEHLGIPVLHLDENGQPQTQEQIISLLTGNQLSLFGEEHFHSRKRYALEKSKL